MLRAYWHNVRTIPREAWIVLAMQVAFGFSWGGVSGAIKNLYLVRMGYGPAFVGTAYALGTLGYALGSLPAALVIRRLGQRRGMLIGVCAWALGSVAQTAADLLPARWQQPWILTLQLLPACGLALASVGATPFLTGVTRGEQRPHAFALYAALTPFGATLGGLAGGVVPGVIARLTGKTLELPRPYGYALAAAYLVYIPVVWGLIRPQQGGAEPTAMTAPQPRSAAPMALLGRSRSLAFCGQVGAFRRARFSTCSWTARGPCRPPPSGQ